MAKNIELYEEDDFFLEEQNSNEEQIVEEDENEEEPVVNLRPRPARASLTHNAIKSEILKMNKQNRNDSNEDADENLSRSARKRKKRREKVLEERRASGGRNFEDDLTHFKSIPISRRRSSVLPLQTVSLPNHNNGNDGFCCSKFKCYFWILLIIGSLVGLFFWPTVAELELTEQASNVQESNENQIDPEHLINEIDGINDQGEKIINNINKLNDELGDPNEDENQIENEQNEQEEGLSTFGYFSSFFAIEEPADETTDQPNQDEQNNEQELNNQNDENESNDNEQVIEPAITADNQEGDEGFNDQVDEGFDDQVYEEFDQTAATQQNEENENSENTIPERYRSAVHQEDNFEDENSINSCLIGDVNYSHLNEEQCSILQERHRQLEQQLREQEQLIRQEQQVDNNEETFYFF